jgi:non-ribosomal peptide synthetase component E (peptide arylation enzyme)
MKQAINRLALGFLELGLTADDRILCQLPSCIENIAVSIACQKAGLIHCYSPINTWELENDNFLKGLKATAVVTVPEYHKRNHYDLFRQLRDSGRHPYLQHIFLVGEDIPSGSLSINEMIDTPIEEKYPADYLDGRQVSAFDVHQVMTTSGSTGLPKMVEETNNGTRMHGLGYIENFRVTGDDTCFTSGFLWTGPTVCGLWVMPQVGGRIIVVETFDAGQALQIIEKERPTYFSGFPPQIIDLARHADLAQYNTDSLRFLLWAGAPFPFGVARECEDNLKCHLVSGLGAVDSCMLFIGNIDDTPEIRLETVGRPLPWDECKVMKSDGSTAGVNEVGTLYWRGASGAGGYYQNPEQTKKVWGELGLNGWYNTQDAGYLDINGNLRLAGRVSDMVQRGGQNIFPGEIEDILSSHPSVAEIYIVPMPDTRLGEKSCAYIVTKSSKNLTLDEINAYLQGKNLAKYKLPERLEIIESSPKVGQKVNKRALALDVCRKMLNEGKITEDLAIDFEKKRNLKA